MSEEQTEYKNKARATVWVIIPIPMDVLEMLEYLSTDETPVENVASLMLGLAAREAARLK